mmetsp:Transcript_84984/g.150262  ORF Transcript_84984/g.150262 Transcript_84984/m.150262 type:complete len:522 (-) Transcript_84984:179-1744(-)
MRCPRSVALGFSGALLSACAALAGGQTCARSHGLMAIQRGHSVQVQNTSTATSCEAERVQRRRRNSEMCSCRRRSGTADLATGWACMNDVISFGESSEGISTSRLTPSWTTIALPPERTEGCLELFVIGDMGTRGSTQREIAAAMAKVAEERDPVAIAAIGDNIYGDGAEENFSILSEWWRDVYLPHPALNRPWYVVTGNHDWHSDATYERDFTQHPENTGGWWRMPNFWYKRSFESSSSNLSLDAFFIDTQIWKGSSLVERVLGANAYQEQITWLSSELASSKADWKIVLGHHPIYSAGSHGTTEDLLAELDPLLRQHFAHIYFNGHDHNKQLIQYQGMNYITSGAGGKNSDSRSNEEPSGSLQHIFQDSGFASLAVCSKSSATLTFYGEQGQPQATTPLTNAPPLFLVDAGNRHQDRFTSSHVHTYCGQIAMQDVDKACRGAGNCRIVADQRSNKSCDDFCKASGLSCLDGWTEGDEDCFEVQRIGCETTCRHAVQSSSLDLCYNNLICECNARGSLRA